MYGGAPHSSVQISSEITSKTKSRKSEVHEVPVDTPTPISLEVASAQMSSY